MSNRQFLPGWATRATVARPTETRSLSATIQNPPKASLLYKLKSYGQYRVKNDLKTWREAVEAAENPQRPDRTYLYELYRVAMQDAHLLAQLRTAVNQITLASFELIDEQDLPDDDARKLLATSWFDKFLEEAVKAELWGYALVEFDAKARRPDGTFMDVFTIPRRHVRPEYGDVVFDIGTERGVSFLEGPWTKFLIGIGDRSDLGLLRELTPLAIRKAYNLTDWSRRNEKFGMPFVVAKTASRNNAELDAKTAMLAGLGSNNFALLDDMDEIDFIESKAGQGAHLTFKEYIELCDTEISMLVNGQSGTQDEQAYVGSAKVHERILNSYTKARMRRIQNAINDRLLPFLTMHGYPMATLRFEFTELRPRTAAMDLPGDEGDTQEDEDDDAKK